jgi:hypothetical protein
MQYLYPIWFFFAAVFSYFAYVHWRQSNVSIRPFTARGLEEGKGKDSEAAPLIAEFVRDFNKYLATANETNRSMNRNATIMYFVAVVVSVLALFMSVLA